MSKSVEQASTCRPAELGSRPELAGRRGLGNREATRSGEGARRGEGGDEEVLAELYGVEVSALNQAVKRNLERFPEDFMFRLTQDEAAILRSQIVTSSARGHGGRRYLPYAFTEHGVAMLSSVLRSERAVHVNIEIMRAFVRLRQIVERNGLQTGPSGSQLKAAMSD
jgi:hypothetical protein